ncbi:MAG: flagellar biosynthetic protein FliP, partial [Betaproteobacteria bacterium]|nr:flagellar biosynthetic protein FliP [Betaproteobacteria bacterium]
MGLLAFLGAMLVGIWPQAATAQELGQLPLLVGSGESGTSFSVPIQTLLFFTALSFLPAVLLMMTA